MSVSSDAEGYRTLADQLRGWSDDRLSRLLRERPDLGTPAPHDSSQLAARAATRTSVVRALDRLTRFELCVLDALVVAGQTSAEDVPIMLHADPESVDAALERLVDLALVWHAKGGLRTLTDVADALTGGAEGGMSGLLPVSPDAPPPDEVRRRLDELSPAARTMLEHVVESGGQATTEARQTVLPEDARNPAEELLSRRLLVPRGGGGVLAPGEVGLALRAGRTTRERVDAVPELASSSRDQAHVDRTAAGAAFESVRRMELLLDHWGTEPPACLRSGGLGVRELRAAATVLHVDERTAGLLIELSAAAGLMAEGLDAGREPVWLPTDAFDAWLDRPVGQRWVSLVRAWLETTRVPGLVGSRDPSGKARNALAPDLSSVFAPEGRRMALEAVAALPPGEVLATGTGVASVVARVEWMRPRRPRSRADHVVWALDEAALLGVCGLGGLSTAARSVLDGDDEKAAETLAPLLPEPVEQVLIQADLTAVAPGPLESALARRLQLVADVESRGGATVYRFTPGSVRRALDVGWTAVELHDFVSSVSRTPVPQPLTYLVDDVARRFGTVRVGHAEAFLRADDETVLAELLHHPKAASLGLRRIAPTVLVTSTPLDVLMPRLRELGAAPVVEAADGTVHVVRPDQLRARRPRGRRGSQATSARESAHVAQVVTAIRAGDRATSSRPPGPRESLTPTGSLTALREAIEAGVTVLIGYVDNHGATSERVVDPVRVEGGWLTAYDHRSDDTRTFAVHRITTVRPIRD